ncbi:MAG: glutamate 5-kinase [Deltaproteobacteria bacterium]|nr:glutamate 5-kinase [Deltaproteobacteria bacterium]
MSAALVSGHPARVRLTSAKRVVVKIGSALLRSRDHDPFAHFAAEVISLRRQGKTVVVVSSGAIALGYPSLKLATRPTELAALQASAAAGQSKLMAHWAQAFGWFDVDVAQILLTHADLQDRRRYNNAKGALAVLLERGLIPIVNENDTVSVDEIKLGDNDTLAAAVSGLIDADAVVLLTSAAGLFTADPSLDATARRIDVVDDLTPEVRAYATGAAALGTGGMITKLDAAAIARRHGAQTVIARGLQRGILREVFDGHDVGTVISATASDRDTAKRRWIGSLKSRGSIVVDDGAVAALLKNSSLLFAGVVAVEGDFAAWEVVTVKDRAGKVFARGLCAVSAETARLVMGKKTAEAQAVVVDLPDELLHRDDLVLD